MTRFHKCLCSTVFALTVLALSARAQTPDAGGRNHREDGGKAPDQIVIKPNYDLEARFLPENIKKLIFSTSVVPHWFENSDRFWYSYETSEATHYYIVDPAKKTKTQLWDNAKVAAALSSMTGLGYDGQHLPVKRLKLVDSDTKIRFAIDVPANAVIPGESPKEKLQGNSEEKALKDTNSKAEPSPQTRVIVFEFELGTGKIIRLDKFDDSAKRAAWASVSPDKKTIIFARGENLYMMDAANHAKAQKNPGDPSIVEVQLTTDGVPKYSYAESLVPEQKDLLQKLNKGDVNQAGYRTPPIAIHWSKDSSKFSLIREDARKVGELWVIHNLANPRPILETYPYAMPGEKNLPQPEIQIFDVATKQRVLIQPKNFVDQTLTIFDAPQTERERQENQEAVEGMAADLKVATATSRWLSDTPDKVYFFTRGRSFRGVDVCVADSSTGATKILIQERSNAWVYDRPLRLVGNGEELLWWSQRDGWAHYYRFDRDGKLLNQITSGEYMTDQIISLDEKARIMYFTANGREPGEDPYYTHLYRVNLDGSGLKLLTPGNFSHAISAPDSGKYFVDTFSRVDAAPKSSLFDQQGFLLDLEATDMKLLFEVGYKYPELIKVKADDGVTDLYGVMYKPFDFDPSRRYPVVEAVYPGPQAEGVTKIFTTSSVQGGYASQDLALAQLGFIVIEVGARGGSPQRDRWYDTFGYGNLRDYGLADKKAAIEQLAALHPFIDINRVGVWGHSGGGFMSTALLLQYPDFYKAAFSESGNHNNNIYNNVFQ